ncbi:MAG TPA: bifunctional UDP-N-acetylglucosamine diphosphorylase/glucosamine-1-phosphate N-acetyltransferase GlmU [Syntrophorhabdaceae bacterium]|jgi:bifunctional UDP-N-acetylglucosamine pyrophosphorylase/glucosamine-1-phosphate N-acetyltransferase
MKGLNVVILAAGKGERMVSRKSKVMHEVMGAPMIGHVVERAEELSPEAVIVVVGHGRDQIEAYLRDRSVSFAVQTEQKGTAHALLTTLPFLREGPVLVLYGDVPLIETATLKKFIDSFEETGDISFMITDVENPTGYGRVIVEEGKIRRIVEHNDATEEQRRIRTINTGICILPRNAINLVETITPDNRKGEYYLTDICAVAGQSGKSVRAYFHPTSSEVLGINSRRELMGAHLVMKERILDRLLDNGVTLLDRNIYIEARVVIGKDTVIYPNCFISGNTVIGEDVVIGPNSLIKNSTLRDKVEVEGFVSIDGATVEGGAKIGPFARLRPTTTVKKGAKVGNFVEVKNSIISEGAKASHLSYIGDAEVGRDVNIGAGTITCNYDGKKKHRTVLEDNVFIGSNTALVAPVRIGRNAVIGAGSTITKDVPEDALGVTRAPQKQVEGYSRRKK